MYGRESMGPFTISKRKLKLDKTKQHTIEIVVDRLLIKPGIEKRLENSIEVAMKLAKGIVLVAVVNGEETALL